MTLETYSGVEDFCRRLYPDLVSTFALYTGSLQVGEDVAQETLIRACATWGKLSGHASPRKWAFHVGFNVANSWWRRQILERRRSSQRRPKSEVNHVHDPADSLAIRVAVSSLPRRQRAALICRYFSDLTVAETADLLGCAPGTVKALTSQAIARLRTQLTIDIHEEEQ